MLYAIEERIQSFWRLSAIYNGRRDSSLTISEALEAVDTLLSTVGPRHKQLRKGIKKLQEDLIMHGPKYNKTPMRGSSVTLPFIRPASKES